jgi:predicted nucleic acid-binding protein
VTVFIDSNIPMYIAGVGHPNRDPARRFMKRVRDRQIEAATSTEVLQEILYRYAAIGRRDLGGHVYDLFVELCPTILPVTVAETDRARELLDLSANLSPRDALHVAVMLNHDIDRIATFDKAFDDIPGIARLPLR